MEIKWPNVVAFALAILGVVLMVRHRYELGATLASLGPIGTGPTPADRTLGFCVLGVLLVALVAVVRLVCSSNRKDR